MRRGRMPAYLAAAVLSGALAIGVAPSPAAAIEPLVGIPIPDEEVGTTLPAEYMQSTTFDLDGDGTRELITVGTATDAAGLAALQAWWVDASGRATGSNEIIVRRAASVDEQLTERLTVDRDGMVAVKIAEGTQLFVARHDGGAHLYLAGEGLQPDGSQPCCLTIWEVTAGADHTITLTLVANTSQSATTLAIADLDGDETDELFVIEGPWSWEGDVAPPAEMALLRWAGDRFVRRVVAVGSGLSAPLSVNSSLDLVGETDGQPGDDLLFSQWDQNGEHQRTIRITLRGSAFHAETSDVENLYGYQVVPLATGPVLLTSDGSSGLQLRRWPRDQGTELQASRQAGDGVVAVLGTGAEARILAGSGGYPTTSVAVLPADLGGGAGPRAEFTRDGRSAAMPIDLSADVPLWQGVLRDGLPGLPDVYVFSGQFVYPVADPRRPAASQPGPLMVGTRPVGSVGPGGTWEVMTLNDNNNHYDPQGQPHISWMFNQPAPGLIWLVAAEALTQPEAHDGKLSPTFYGAALDPARDQALLVGSEAVEAEVHGPPGTVVHWTTRGVTGGLGTIDQRGLLVIPLLEAAVNGAPNGSGATATIWVTTPAGHSYGGTWRLRVFRTPPDLEMTVPDGLFVLDPAVIGQTAPGARVTINGTPVEVSPTGVFRVPVGAGIVPTELRIVATDPVDNTTARVVSVLWPLDYRRLPFVPLAVVITVIAGLFLYLRRPEAKPGRRVTEEDATFEEIGG